jgi:hypothetical protein
MRQIVLLLMTVFLLAGCGAPPPAPVEPETQKFIQPLLLRVLDSMDRPVDKAMVVLNAKAGAPIGASKLATNQYGEAAVSWSPKVVDFTAGSKSRDEVFDLLSQLEFTISKKGYFPARGSLKAEARGRRLYDPNLKPLSHEPVLRLKSDTVVLRRSAEVFGGRLKGKPLSDPLVSQLMKFYQSMALVVPHLGVEFAWPAFLLESKNLTLNFDWHSASWATLGHAPFLAKVTAGSLLPLARAVGEELSTLPDVDNISLKVLSEITPPDDPYALPTTAKVTLSAPHAAYVKLAANQMSPDEFLRNYPPSLAVKKPPRSAQSAAAAPKPEATKETK